MRRFWMLAGFVASVAAAGELPLGTAALPSGTRVAGTGVGEVVTWEPSGALTRWDSSGRRLGTASTGELRPGAGTVFAARGGRALACVPQEPGVLCRVLAIATGQSEGSFAWDEYPVRSWPADDGWLLASVPATGTPRVARWTFDGAPRGEVVLPAAELAALGQHLDVAVAALNPRLLAVRGTLWAIPAGRYEFWRLGSSPVSRDLVPSCRRVEGYHFAGEEASRRMAAYFSCTVTSTATGDDPAAEIEKIMSTLPSPPAGAASAASATRTFVAAVGRVAVSGSLVAVRIEPPPGGAEARVDVWDFTGTPRLVGDAAVPPGAWEPVEVSRDAVWIACQHTARRLAVRAAGHDPCGATSP